MARKTLRDVVRETLRENDRANQAAAAYVLFRHRMALPVLIDEVSEEAKNYSLVQVHRAVVNELRAKEAR